MSELRIATSNMSPKQLLLAAIEGRPVDRLPVTTYNFHPFSKDPRASESRSFSQEPAYQPMLDAVLRTNTGMLCKVSAEHRGGREERTTVESRRQGDTVLVTTCLQTPKGELRRVFRKPEGQPGRYVEPFVKSDDDLQKYFSLPDEPSIPDLSTAKRVHDELGDRGLVYMSYEDPLYAVAQLFGFESLAMRCIQQFSLVKEMVDREFERIRAQLEHVLREGRGYDFLFHTAGPEIATPPLLPPHMFQQLVTPYHRELVSMIKAAGYHCAIHCHGKVGKVFDEFLDTGTDVLEPMEPPPQGDMTLEEALDKAEGRICLMGYIQDQDLYTCTPDEIREKVRAICGLVRGRPGYIMSTTATPYMFPPPERFVGNYVAFVEAAAN